MASSLCTSLFQSRALDSKSVCSVFNLNPGKARWPSISPPLNWMTCCCSHSPELLELHEGFRSSRRKAVMGLFTGVAISLVYCDKVGAVSTSKRALRSQKIPENEYTNLPNGLKYYDLKVGSGTEAAKGSRVVVHYVAKWRGITFMTSRQGMGITGGTPYGFDVGASERGAVLKGLDLGVQGMRVGGQRLLIVPPELAYGNKGIQEIPPNATLESELHSLSHILKDAFDSFSTGNQEILLEEMVSGLKVGSWHRLALYGATITLVWSSRRENLLNYRIISGLESFPSSTMNSSFLLLLVF